MSGRILLKAFIESHIPLKNYDICNNGEFNLPHSNWSSRNSPNADDTSLMSMTTENSLIQLVNSSTHKDGNILDLCFVTNYYLYSVEVDHVAIRSDHFPLHITLDVPMIYNDDHHVAQTNNSTANIPSLTTFDTALVSSGQNIRCIVLLSMVCG